MKIRKIVNKIMALGIGASMVGATITGAVATDLVNYPAPFIKDGKFNGVLVVGDRAAAEDVIGASDIAASLQFAATTPVATETETVLEGDAWKVGTSTKILELAENLKSGTNKESIATITSNSFIDDAELEVLLEKGKTRNTKGSAAYDQRLYFEDATTGFVQLLEDDTDVTADFLYFQSGKQIVRYELEFTSALESDVDDINGRSSTTGNFLSDFEDVDITILGKKYTIVQATRNGANQGQILLGLMTGPIKDSLVEGDTKTYTFNGQDFEVTLEFVDSTNAKFLVNGESTRLLRDGETGKLSDGTIIGVTEILYQDYAGGVHMASFFLGAQKLELKDTDITDSSSSHELKVNEKTIDGAHVTIEGSDDNSIFKIDRIGINMTADDNYYVPKGGNLSNVIDQKDLLFTSNWDVSYQGLSSPKTQEIAIKASGSDDYILEFVDKNGNRAKLPIMHAVSGSTIRFGDNDDDLIVQENKTITKDDYFILTDETDKNGERSSFALRYRGADKITSDSPIIKFDELGSGDRIERPISVGSVLSGVVGPDGQDLFEISQIKLGGRTFKVYNASSIGSNDFDILVDINGDNTIGSNVVSLNTQYGTNISIENSSSQGVTVLIGTPNSNHYDDLAPTSFIFNLNATGGEARLSLDPSQNHNFITPDDDDRNEYAYSSYGAYAKRSTPSNAPQEVSIEYPQSQRVPLVYITESKATFTETEKAVGGAVKIQRIDVGATKLASEVKNIREINAILVGGPCANVATAELLGNPEDCTLGFEPGVGRIELYENDGNVAMLVAGYTKEDTRNVAQVIANHLHYKDDLKGNAAEVKQTDSTLIVAESMLKAGIGATEK
ncbi:S-layer protein [Candidatus Woesearchaeota archaeon]|nr:S-layer protein [Candidatus Woesearchaeota archaeon]